MKRKIIYLICCFLFLSGIAAQKAFADEIEIESPSAILIDADSGQILYEKNAYEKRYPASITKIMTTYLAAAYGDLNSTLTASKEAIDAIGKNASNIGLQPNEILSFEDAVYGAYLVSANEACNVLAESISGSIEEFVDLMNETAYLSGAAHTHFANTNGLPNENHYTTAYDMAMITRFAMKNEKWMEFFTAETYTMPATNLSSERILTIGNEAALSSSPNYYPGTLGGKTGWTPDAKFTLVTACRKNDRTLIVVILGCEKIQDRYDDTRTLFDYGFKMVQNTYLAEDFIFPSAELTNEDEIIAAASFSLEEDISFLYSESIPFEDLTVDLSLRHPNNPERLSALLTLSYQNKILYQTEMHVELVDPVKPNNSIFTNPFFAVSSCLCVLFLILLFISGISKKKKKE